LSFYFQANQGVPRQAADNEMDVEMVIMNQNERTAKPVQHAHISWIRTCTGARGHGNAHCRFPGMESQGILKSPSTSP
jgi:hypothetical protein